MRVEVDTKFSASHRLENFFDQQTLNIHETCFEEFN